MPISYSYTAAEKEFSTFIRTIKQNQSNCIKFKPLTEEQTKALTRTLRPLYGGGTTQASAKNYEYKIDSPLDRVAKGQTVTVKLDPSLSTTTRSVELNSQKIKTLQQTVKIYFKGEEINQNTAAETHKIIRHLYSIKYNQKIPPEEIPAKYTGHESFAKYKVYLEEQGYYLVCRFESMTYFNKSNELLPDPKPVVQYESYLPKLTHQGKNSDYQSHGFRQFTQGETFNKLRKIKEIGQLKKIYKAIFHSHLKIASQNNELYSTVIPGVLLSALHEDEQLRAKRCYVSALVEVVKEIKEDINRNGSASQYTGFRGVMVCCAGVEVLNKIIEDVKTLTSGLLIFNNPLYTSALDELSNWSIITAQPIMGEAFSAIGNGALGDSALQAPGERDIRHSLGINAAVTNPHYNPTLAKILEKPKKNLLTSATKITTTTETLSTMMASLRDFTDHISNPRYAHRFILFCTSF